VPEDPTSRRPFGVMTMDEQITHLADDHGELDVLLEMEREAKHQGGHPQMDWHHTHRGQ
jgi:hypothetical protein